MPTTKSPFEDIASSTPRRTGRSLLTTTIALGMLAPAGCDPGVDDGPATRVSEVADDESASEGEACVSLFPESVSSLQATPPTQALAFDFATGNAPIEVVIPAVIPVIFANVKPGDATLVLRFTTMLTNSWFDATAPYHPTAIGVYSDLGRRPAGESVDNTHMNTAIMYASFHVLNSLAPQHAADWIALMESLGLDPDDTHEGTGDAIGIGNAAGAALVAVREHDGFNQLGDENGKTYHRQPYSDYTGYEPKNTAYKLKDERRWQPNIDVSRYGITRVQGFVTPQYALTLPYSYDDPEDFGVPLPDKSYKKGWHGKQKYKAQADQVLEASANLTDEQKLIAELFDDKIRSLGFSALFVAVSQGMSLMEFVHYDFLTNMAAFDVGIVVWQEKRQWDAVRPMSAIHHIYGDDEVTGWGGPGVGTVTMPGNEWRGYLNVADHPEYPSGSSAFCHAHAQASRLYLGTDNLGWTVPIPAGSSVVEPGVTPAVDTNLHFATFTEFATECGYSRLYGGVHFEDAILVSADLGTEIGTHAYEFVQAHIDGDV
jgi:hypothetical protein